MKKIFFTLLLLFIPFIHGNTASVPRPIGNYKTFQISGKNIYINQIALENGKVKNPGTIGRTVSIEEAQVATRLTAQNVLSVLKEAVGGNLSKVKKTVQLTGYFKTAEDFYDHALLMDEASNLIIKELGDRGQHARATVGVISLPLNSVTEIQAIFEIE